MLAYAAQLRGQTNHRLFWDGVEGRAPMPPAAQTLGLEIVAVDPDAGTIDLSFQARSRTGRTRPATCSARSSPRCSTTWSGRRC
ncbi:MAG: hypothetical protein QOJ30_3425 [Pseudonocardiales bacterium]|nr:hypothetical protein [Pseudonocardiales bacterium]